MMQPIYLVEQNEFIFLVDIVWIYTYKLACTRIHKLHIFHSFRHRMFL